MIGKSKIVMWIPAVLFGLLPFFVNVLVRFTGRFEFTLGNVLGSQELLFYCVIILCAISVNFGGNTAIDPDVRIIISSVSIFMLVLCCVIFGLYCAENEYFAKKLDPVKSDGTPIFVLIGWVAWSVAFLAVSLTAIVFLVEVCIAGRQKAHAEKGAVRNREAT